MRAIFASFGNFLLDIYRKRQLLVALAVRDFKSRYLGSAFGIFWGYCQPAITIAIVVFVFEVGFKSLPVGDVPFALWFVTAMVPWLFIAEAMQSGTNSISEYSYLVQKVAFRVSILPIIKIISALLIHVFFILVLLGLLLGFNYELHICNIQVFYYLFASIVLLLGTTWLTSALVVFLKDVGQVVAMILNFGFWLTPIMWNISMIPEQYRFWFKLNPAFYVTEGYRNSLLYHKWFWGPELIAETVLFWFTAIFLFFAGALVFRQLKPHFADVI